jgi:hypothetical protein
MPKVLPGRLVMATAAPLAALVLGAILLGGCGSGCIQGYHWSDANQSVVLQTNVDWETGFSDTVPLTGQCTQTNGHDTASCLVTVPNPMVMAASGAVNISSGNGDLATGTTNGTTLDLNWRTVSGGSRNVVFTDDSCS